MSRAPALGRALSAWALLVAAILGGCADDPFVLSGSLGQLYPLEAEGVRARLYPSELSIAFTRLDGQVPLRLTLRRAERDPLGPGSYDLGAFGDITGAVDRIPLPTFISGTLTLERFRPREGAAVEGRFDGRFDAGGALVDLHGDFAATLMVVE